MITSGNAKGLDELGAAVLWSSRGQQVMMQWERQYMHECVDALRIQRSDRVLEIGFGLAYSATRIQAFQPTVHAIVECDAAVIEDAEHFAAQRRGVEVVRGTWQSVLPALVAQQPRRQFDCVFFDDYPLPELETQGVTHNQTRTLTTRSRWHDFLDAVLPLVAAGGRIGGYLARDVDLQRRGCRVEVSQVHVAAAANCAYFPHRTALVPVITVVDAAAAGVCGDDDGAPMPIQTSAKVLRRVIRSSSGAIGGSSSATALDKARVATSSRWRRFVDIRECLHEQDALQDGNINESHGIRQQQQAHADEEEGVDTADAPCREGSPSDAQAFVSSYSDAASRQRYLAALRQKRDASRNAE